MYTFSNNLLQKCKAHLYLRNDNIHEHNTRGCHQLRVLPSAKNISNIRASSRMFSLIKLTGMFQCQYLNVI